MPIDDPLEKIRELAKDGSFDGVSAALQVGGIVSPLFKVVNVATSIAASHKSGERIWIAILALCDELQRTQERWPKDIESVLESDSFKRAMTTLMIESAHAENEERARLLGRFAAQGCFPSGQDAHRQEDLSSYIHDLARLGVDDTQMLKLLGEVHSRSFTSGSRGVESSLFRAGFDRYRRAIDEQKIDVEEAVAICARLAGFGLAIEIPRFETAQGPDELLFRPTRRGIYLLSLLEAAELPAEKQN